MANIHSKITQELEKIWTTERKRQSTDTNIEIIPNAEIIKQKSYGNSYNHVTWNRHKNLEISGMINILSKEIKATE